MKEGYIYIRKVLTLATDKQKLKMTFLLSVWSSPCLLSGLGNLGSMMTGLVGLTRSGGSKISFFCGMGISFFWIHRPPTMSPWTTCIPSGPVSTTALFSLFSFCTCRIGTLLLSAVNGYHFEERESERRRRGTKESLSKNIFSGPLNIRETFKIQLLNKNNPQAIKITAVNNKKTCYAQESEWQTSLKYLFWCQCSGKGFQDSSKL